MTNIVKIYAFLSILAQAKLLKNMITKQLVIGFSFSAAVAVLGTIDLDSAFRK